MTIFFENKFFRFLSEPIAEPSEEGAFSSAEPYYVAEGEEVTPTKLLDKIGTHKSLTIISRSPQQTLDAFCASMPVVRAAGGLVENSAGEVLMITRKGWPDLPKGHIDEGETPEQAAVREVQEETGLQEVSIVAPLCTTRHFHNAYGRWEIKQTEWYLMYAEGESPAVEPQAEENITAVEWLRARRLWNAVGRSYSTIKVVFENFLKYKINN